MKKINRTIFLLLVFVINHSSLTAANNSTRSKIRLGILVSTEEQHKFDPLEVIRRYNARRIDQRFFEPVLAWISLNDTFLSLKSACQLVEKRVVGVIDTTEGMADTVGSVFSFYGIPFLRISYELNWSHESTAFGRKKSINVHPSSKSLHKALLDVLKHFNVNSLVVLYHRDIETLLWKDFVERQTQEASIPIKFFRIAEKNENLRSILEFLKPMAFKHLVYLGRSLKNTVSLLKESLILGLLSSEKHFILSTLEMTSSSLEPFMHSGANITFLSLSEGKDSLDNEISMLEALFTDALSILSKRYSKDILESYPRDLSCAENINWRKGIKIYERIKGTEYFGKSGVLKIDSEGQRSDISLDIWTVSSVNNYDSPMGYWTTLDGLLWKGFKREENHGKLDIFQKRALVISTMLNPPYTMLKKNFKEKKGSDMYEGFVIDLARELAQLLGFNYTIIITQEYGSMDKRGKWSGMIGDLVEERADMAMADLTISFQREQVVDFTMPFLDLGISLLFVKAPEKSINLFAFLSPLSMNVWILMILAGVLVSLTMLFIGRYSPLETEDIDSTEGVTPFSSFHHCLWFSISSWVQQGCDFLPRAISGRVVASIWWFFTLIMISSYTANLAAFLTIERMENPIDHATDLASQNKIRYGAVKSGSTAEFFKNSANEIYHKMGRYMSQHEDECMMNSVEDGLDKVLSENGAYAFFMESISIEYYAERNCRLQQVGGLLDSKSYGIAVSQGSPLRSHLSSAIIKLNENGKIRQLKNKWWKKERGGGSCEEEDGSSGSVNELNLENVGGIFMVLLIGLVIGVLIVAIERYYNYVKEKRKRTE